MESNRSDKAVEGRGLAGQHSIPLSVALHLVPGLLIVLAYYFLGVPAARAAGYPSLFGFFLAAAAVLVPWELGVILYAGKQDTGSLTFRPLTFRERLPRLRLFITVFLLFSWALAVVVLLGWLDTVILNSVFSWVPDDFQLYGFSPGKYGVGLFNVATVINLLSFGILFPMIEELYFRGFLLPRMERFGKAAPFANSVLFVFYHFWTPWQFVTRVIFVTPMVWLVWKKRSVELGIWTHCFMNSFGIVLTYVGMMGTL